MSVSRRHFFLGSLALPVFAAKPAPPRPNVVLFLADNLPAWILGAYGNQEVHTPYLDRLAQGGTRFLNHIVSTPAPGISRATVMTGQTPMQLGNSESPAVGDGSLEKILGGAGYAAKVADAGAASGYLDQQAAGKPFFLTVNCDSLRPPYAGVDKKYLDPYAQTKFETLNLDRGPAANASAGKEMLGDIIGNLRKAAAAITAMDADAGAILTKLAQRQLMDNTVVIFTATCGALLGRHGLWDAGEASEPVNMYEEVVATPLFWSWPGHIPAQAVRPEVVSTYDLVPTLCELLGLTPPAGNLCGRSYALLATGKPLPKKQRPWRTTVFGHFRNTDMARVDKYKIVLRDQGKGPSELYDLVADPAEKVNQIENQQFLTVKTDLSAAAAGWKQRFSS